MRRSRSSLSVTVPNEGGAYVDVHVEFGDVDHFLTMGYESVIDKITVKNVSKTMKKQWLAEGPYTRNRTLSIPVKDIPGSRQDLFDIKLAVFSQGANKMLITTLQIPEMRNLLIHQTQLQGLKQFSRNFAKKLENWK